MIFHFVNFPIHIQVQRWVVSGIGPVDKQHGEMLNEEENPCAATAVPCVNGALAGAAAVAAFATGYLLVSYQYVVTNRSTDAHKNIMNENKSLK